MKLAERILLVLDAVTISIVFLGSFYFRFWSGYFDTFLHTRETHYLYALPIISTINISCLWLLGGYSIRRPSSYPAQLVNVLHSVVLTAIIFLALVFWYRAWSFSRWVIVLYVAVLTLILPLLRSGFCTGLAALRRKGFDSEPILAICNTNRKDEVTTLLQENPELGFRLVNILYTEQISQDTHPTLYSMMQENASQHVYLSIAAPYNELAVELIEQSKEEAESVHIHPAMYTLLRAHPRWRVIDDGIWFTLERSAWDRLYQAVKRTMDVAIAAIVLALSIPLLFFLALFVCLESPGPIIFRQQRAGLNGRPFTIFKLRSMHADAEKQLEDILDFDRLDPPVFKMVNDPRVTKVGKFLRRFSLDELPQLWNVIRGDMSLVGPRPEEYRLTQRYDKRTRQRLRIKPGLTGYQQIKARGTDNMELRLNHDLYYLDHQSLVFDIYILFQTIWVVLWGKGRI